MCIRDSHITLQPLQQLQAVQQAVRQAVQQAVQQVQAVVVQDQAVLAVVGVAVTNGL